MFRTGLIALFLSSIFIATNGSAIPDPALSLHNSGSSHHFSEFIPGGHHSPDELKDLAETKHGEMKGHAAAEGLVHPATISALHKPGVGTWLHSSVKGQSSEPFHPKTQQLMNQCKGEHRTGGNCADVGAIHMAHTDGHEVHGTHMATFGLDKHTGTDKHLHPCHGVKEGHGCKDVLEKAGVHCWTRRDGSAACAYKPGVQKKPAAPNKAAAPKKAATPQKPAKKIAAPAPKHHARDMDSLIARFLDLEY